MKRCRKGAECIGQKECNFQVTLRKNIEKESKKTVLKYSQLSNIPLPYLFLSVLTPLCAATVEFQVVQGPMKAVFKTDRSETLPKVAAFLGIESEAQG